MKKILIFSTNYFPNVGGAEIAVKEITDRLPDIEFDMLVPRISRKNPTYEKIGNVAVYRVGLGISFDKFLFPKLALLKALLLHAKRRYGGIWSIMASQASIAAAFFKMLHKSIPLILTLQEGDEEEHLARYVFGNRFLYKYIIKPWHLLVFRYADYVTAISNYLKDRAVKNGVSPEKITIIPNGVNIERFTPAGRDLTSLGRSACLRQAKRGRQEATGKDEALKEQIQLKQKLGIAESEKVIITTSRLVKKNAIGDLIESIRYLPDDVKLLILGTGPEEEALKAKAYKLHGRVQFLGNIGHSSLPAYLHISDLFVRPSLSEGMGNSFIEAMAAGVPVVATPVGGIPDFLVHEKTGLFCEVHNPKSIAAQATRLISEVQLRRTIISNAQKMVAEKYDWDIIAKQMKELIFFGRATSEKGNWWTW